MIRKTAVMEVIKAHMNGENKNTKAVLSDVMESVNELEALSQEPMRDFTEEEAKAYSKTLDKMYKPTGFNVFNEPCTDAVSREAVCIIVNDIRDCISVEGYCAILERLKKLPPVNPQNTGTWIHFAQSDDCSLCGYSTGKYGSPSNYCPNCGARMIEPQERSE